MKKLFVIIFVFNTFAAFSQSMECIKTDKLSCSSQLDLIGTDASNYYFLFGCNRIIKFNKNLIEREVIKIDIPYSPGGMNRIYDASQGALIEGGSFCIIQGMLVFPKITSGYSKTISYNILNIVNSKGELKDTMQFVNQEIDGFYFSDNGKYFCRRWMTSDEYENKENGHIDVYETETFKPIASYSVKYNQFFLEYISTTNNGDMFLMQFNAAQILFLQNGNQDSIDLLGENVRLIGGAEYHNISGMPGHVAFSCMYVDMEESKEMEKGTIDEHLIKGLEVFIINTNTGEVIKNHKVDINKLFTKDDLKGVLHQGYWKGMVISDFKANNNEMYVLLGAINYLKGSYETNYDRFHLLKLTNDTTIKQTYVPDKGFKYDRSAYSPILILYHKGISILYKYKKLLNTKFKHKCVSFNSDMVLVKENEIDIDKRIHTIYSEPLVTTDNEVLMYGIGYNRGGKRVYFCKFKPE